MMHAYRFARACGNYDEIIMADEEPTGIVCPACGVPIERAVEARTDPSFLAAEDLPQ
jgi:predicted RNA-binding Zn-ribbon protein involved in translation (DUF1610 family)